MRKLEKYSMGVGDRFNRQAKAQLSALMEAEKRGIELVPVWNKSYREHSIIGSKAESTREQADAAVRELVWNKSYYVDADHIGLATADFFLKAANFYTLDVADFIGKAAPAEVIEKFIADNKKYLGSFKVPGIAEAFTVEESFLRQTAGKYLAAAAEAGKIFRFIASKKDPDDIVIEVSMDETDAPQTPLEMFFILSALASEKIPMQTVAPKFSGRFNKGVDYVGDAERFGKEFEEDLAVVKLAVSEFNLPENLKLSVHSGSDKFSIYPKIAAAIKKTGAGLHLKTAGTTWLEELIGLAEAGGKGLETAKTIYERSLKKYDILTGPYSTVIDIDKQKLPSAEEVKGWSSEKYVNSLRHDLSNPEYDLNFRQLLHVGYKIAADMGEEYLSALSENEETIAKNVKENILERHIMKIFA